MHDVYIPRGRSRGFARFCVIGCGAVAILALCGFPLPALKMMYSVRGLLGLRCYTSVEQPVVKYTDDKGGVHYVSSVDLVPVKYRAAAERDVFLPRINYAEYDLGKPSKPAPAKNSRRDKDERKPNSAKEQEAPTDARSATRALEDVATLLGGKK